MALPILGFGHNGFTAIMAGEPFFMSMPQSCRRHIAMSMANLFWLIIAPAHMLAADVSLPAFRSLIRQETWAERWPDSATPGQFETREVTAGIWNTAIQAALDQDNQVHLPKLATPYYLDSPIILKSGQKLTADSETEIRLKPGTNTALVRNEHIIGYADRPMPTDGQPDTGISIEGGIWTTLATGERAANGNLRGASSKDKPIPGTHGVILLHNVRQVTVRNVTIHQSKAFGVHLANAQDFLVEGVKLDRHGRDGVHVNGPSSNGIIRHVSGDSHDDPVSIAAWDWWAYASSYGPIHHILIEHVTGAAEEKHATDAIRLLPGVKRFADGSTLDCPIHDVTLSHITDIRDFKLYDQPDLEAGRDKDFSVAIGILKNIRFEDLVFTRPGSIQVHAETDGLIIEGVRYHYLLQPNQYLVEFGPKSATYKGGSTDPTKWVEIFSPDRDATLRNLSISNVRDSGSQADLPMERLIQIIQQKPNPDYPKTTPRGGTGKGIWLR